MKKFTDIILNESQKIDDDQLKKGIKVESEHGDIYEQLKEWMDKTYKEYSSMPWSKEEFYGKIAKAHLREIPDYYKRLEKMEKEWKKNESKEISIEIPDVIPMQIRVMEREMGEWVIDVCDISLELNDHKIAPYGDTKPIIPMKMPMEKMFQEKYPEIWSKFTEQKSDKYGCDDISEYIHQLHGDNKLGDEYYQMYADIYNLDPSFKRFFQARWKEYNLDNPYYKY